LVRHLFHVSEPRLESGRFVAISFDDGPDFDYLDYHHPDWGYLKSFQNLLSQWPGLGWDGTAPRATSFVIASPRARAELDRACIAGRNQWRDDWWPEATRDGLLEIANHSWDHTHLSLETLAIGEEHRGTFQAIGTFEDADTEILQAEKLIREKTGNQSVPLFAYPYGEYSTFLVEEYFPDRSEWFQAAFTTEGAPVTQASHRWKLPRYVCGHHWKSSEELASILQD
jgi:peptidoglycan/xylan/chitin deacetylase (PgdA/CDA1 family)